jgi:hypothetical protein
MLPLALVLASVLQAGQNADLARAIQQLQNLDERGALRSLELARRQPGISREELAQVHLYTGLAKAELFGQKEATKAFRAALDLDPNIRLPRTASPLVRGWWGELGGIVEAAPALVPALAPPGPPPAPVVVTERVVVHDTAPAPPSRTHRWVGVSIAALGVGVIAAALVLGARATATQRQSTSEADVALSASEHASAVQQAQTANKVGVVGGGLAIAGGVVFVW